jgi:hypothetical protein
MHHDEGALDDIVICHILRHSSPPSWQTPRDDSIAATLDEKPCRHSKYDLV